MDSDDGIEVVKQSPGDESQNKDISGLLEYDPLWNLNQLSLNRSGSLLTDSVNPGSIHALQTAFASLQRKYNNRERCFSELVHKCNAMQRSIMDARRSEYSCFDTVDSAFVQETPSLVYAAAGTSENESALAENGATQGLIQHLRREGLRCQNECIRLKKLVDNLESEKNTNLRRLELFQAEVGNLSVNLVQHQQEIERLGSYVNNLELDNTKLKQTVGMFENISNFRDSEIQDLMSKLTTVENERQKVAEQLKESQKKLLLSDREVKTLEMKCKQHEVQIEILKDQRQTDDCDDVDGDISVLSKCLEIIQIQKKEISDLKEHTLIERQFLEQAGLLTGNVKTMKNTEIWKVAADSFHQKFEECSDIHIYESTAGSYPGNQLNKTPVQLTHQHSDCGTYTTVENSGVKSGHRVQEYLVLTGNQNVTNMIAKEVSNTAIKREVTSNGLGTNSAVAKGANVHDLSNLSRNLNVKDIYKSLSVPGLLQACDRPYLANIDADSRNQINQNAVAYQISPSRLIVGNDSQRNVNISDIQTQTSEATYQNNTPKFTVPSNYNNLQYNNNRRVASPKCLTGDGMTKSDMINRAESCKDVATLYSTLSLLDISPKKQDETVSNQVYGYVTPLNISDPPRHMHINAVREEIRLPDYENVYFNSHKDASRIIEENEDTSNHMAIHSNKSEPIRTKHLQEQGCDANMVSQLKICPACNLEFSRFSMTDFQQHVCECFEHGGESPETLQGEGMEDDRVCPMCQASFPLTISQETYEQHVFAHFGDEPIMGNFELVPKP